MKTLIFKETNKTFHKIVEVDGEKYLLDMTTISPRTYFWGRRVGTITAKMVKLEKYDKNFESLTPTMSRSLGTAIGLVIGGTSYRLMNSFFKNHDVSHNMSLKVGLFILSILLTYIAFWSFVTFLRHSVKKRILSQEQKYKISFRRITEQHNFVGCKLTLFFSVANLTCLILYFLNNDGTEGVFAGLNCLVLLLVFTFSLGMLPLRESYEKTRNYF